MVREHAVITATDGPGFEKALEQALPVIRAARGCLSAEVTRCVEEPNLYLLLVEWETIEDHTIGFRESPAFAEWRSHVGPFFAAPPLVQHFESL